MEEEAVASSLSLIPLPPADLSLWPAPVFPCGNSCLSEITSDFQWPDARAPLGPHHTGPFPWVIVSLASTALLSRGISVPILPILLSFPVSSTIL